MADNNEIEPGMDENLKRQIRQRYFREAMATSYDLPSNDARFDALLQQVEEAERLQQQ